LTDFYQFVCKSIDNDDLDSPGNTHATASDKKDEVYLGTIHRAKGKEFQNVVYFNLSKTATKSEKIGEEEERRVAYVGATRPKDSLLITFPAVKPSTFLPEISLNPKYKGIDGENLEHKSASKKRSLQKEEINLHHIELHVEKLVVQFNQLMESLSSKKPLILLRFTRPITNWRTSKIQEKIDRLNQRAKKHKDTIIEPLLIEISDLEEETNLRSAIKGPQAGET
jgi:ATP-dependent exoDNAse (exonuclease V) beta subunit